MFQRNVASKAISMRIAYHDVYMFTAGGFSTLPFTTVARQKVAQRMKLVAAHLVRGAYAFDHVLDNEGTSS